MVGQTFARLTVVARAGNTAKGQATWHCSCLCGNKVILEGQKLRGGNTKSCGCLRREKDEKARLTLEEKRKRRTERAKIRDKTPSRRLSKNEAQMRYTVTPKAVISAFHRWARKRKNKLELTDDQLMEFRKLPCHKCGKQIEGAGNSFVLINGRGPITLTNMTPTCGICKLIKPKDDFDPIKFAKTTVRRFWKKTPMVSITIQRARRSRGRYECASCNNLFSKKETQVDHIDPVVDPKVGYVDLETWVKRLLCDDSNLQVICTECHSKKTSSENAERQITKKKGKK
jgi:5-methylcytosine-specific restriction endonuclease McrA